MAIHKCITDLSKNFYQATRDLPVGEQMIITNHGKPEFTLLRGDHSTNMSLSASAMSNPLSNVINHQDIQTTIDTLSNLLKNSTLSQSGTEVTNEKEHTHK